MATFWQCSIDYFSCNERWNKITLKFLKPKAKAILDYSLSLFILLSDKEISEKCAVAGFTGKPRVPTCTAGHLGCCAIRNNTGVPFP